MNRVVGATEDLVAMRCDLLKQAVSEPKTDIDEFHQFVASYLVNEKRTDGSPLDSVAHFHLGNGVSLHDIHAATDLTENGVNQSFGAMVSYLYSPERLDGNIKTFTMNKIAVISKKIKALLRASLAFGTTLE